MSRWHLLSQESHDDFKPKRKSAPADLDDAVKMIEEQVGGVIRGVCVRVNPCGMKTLFLSCDGS